MALAAAAPRLASGAKLILMAIPRSEDAIKPPPPPRGKNAQKKARRKARAAAAADPPVAAPAPAPPPSFGSGTSGEAARQLAGANALLQKLAQDRAARAAARPAPAPSRRPRLPRRRKLPKRSLRRPTTWIWTTTRCSTRRSRPTPKRRSASRVQTLDRRRRKHQGEHAPLETGGTGSGGAPRQAREKEGRGRSREKKSPPRNKRRVVVLTRRYTGHRERLQTVSGGASNRPGRRGRRRRPAPTGAPRAVEEHEPNDRQRVRPLEHGQRVQY